MEKGKERDNPNFVEIQERFFYRINPFFIYKIKFIGQSWAHE